MSELLNEYAIAQTRSVARILEVIEEFDIDRYKKNDAICMVHHITSAMNRKWDNVDFGNALLRYAGAEGIFHRAEQIFTNMPKRGAGQNIDLERFTFQFFDFLDDETSKMLKLTKLHQRVLIQYIMQVKRVEEGTIDYEMIYRTRYTRRG